MIELVSKEKEEQIYSDGGQELLPDGNVAADFASSHFDGPLLDSPIEEQPFDDSISKIEEKMRELNLYSIGTNESMINELKELYASINIVNRDKRNEITLSHLICMLLSFYGCWRDAEYLMRIRNLQSFTRSTHAGSVDIYSYIVDVLDSMEVISSILLLCCDSINSSNYSGTFKENLIFAFIDTFNIRMQCVSKESYEWLIVNKRFRVLEQLIENGKLSGSNRKKMERRKQNQQSSMLEYLHYEEVFKPKRQLGEIELLINLNENDLQFLSMEYACFLSNQGSLLNSSYSVSSLLNLQLIQRVVAKENIALFSVFLSADRKGVQGLLMSKEIVPIVLGKLAESRSFSVGLYFLKKMSGNEKKRDSRLSPEFLNSVLRLMKVPEGNHEFEKDMFTHTLHPIVLCLVASKVLFKLSKAINPFSSEMLKLARFYLDRALAYRDTIFDAREMSVVLFQCLFPNDKPLVKALRSRKYSEFFTEFFVHPCIGFLLEQKWMSSYGWNPFILVAFTPAAHILKQAKIKDGKNVQIRKQMISTNGQLISNAQTSSSPQAGTVQGNVVSVGVSQSSAMSSNSSSLSQSGNRLREQTWNIFSVIQTSTLEKLSKNNYIYQYKIFNKSVAVRSIFEFCVFLVIFVTTIYYLFNFIQNQNDFVVLPLDLKDLLFNQKIPEQYYAGIAEYMVINKDLENTDIDYDLGSAPPRELCLKILNRMSYGYPDFIDHFLPSCTSLIEIGVVFDEQTSRTSYICMILFTLGLNVIFKQVYTYLLYRRTTLSALDIDDLIITLTSFAFVVVKFSTLNDGITGYKLDHFEFYTNVLKVIGAILAFLLWLRLTLFLIRSQKIGILVRMIILFIYDLSQFSVILMLILVTFAMLAYILFQKDLDMYATFQLSFFNLVAAMYGAFDFQNQSYVQSLILIIFLLLVNIVMLNVLVAILNTRYEKTMKRSNMDYSLVVYDDYVKMRFSPYYSCMISLPPPFNLLNVVFGTIAVFVRSRKWNSFALKFNYVLFILIPISVMFVIISIVFLPFGYAFMMRSLLIYSGQDNMLNARKKTVIYRIAISIFRFLSWLVLGIPFLLVTLFVNDLPLFFRSAFVNRNNRYTFTKNSVLDIRVMSYASVNNTYLHSARAEVVNYLNFRESLQPNKLEKVKAQMNGEIQEKYLGQTGFQNKTRVGLTATTKTPKGQNGQEWQQQKSQSNSEESKSEKEFNIALKKFGDGSWKSDNINLSHVLNSIKSSIIFFNKSKCTAANISRLLYIVKKKDQFTKLLLQNDKNFFLNRSFTPDSSVTDLK